MYIYWKIVYIYERKKWLCYVKIVYDLKMLGMFIIKIDNVYMKWLGCLELKNVCMNKKVMCIKKMIYNMYIKKMM